MGKHLRESSDAGSAPSESQIEELQLDQAAATCGGNHSDVVATGIGC